MRYSRIGRVAAAWALGLLLAGLPGLDTRAETSGATPIGGSWITLRDPQARPAFVRPVSEQRAASFRHRHPYRFRDDKDWFSQNVRLWVALFEPYVGKPGLRYLEIGVYEGRSMLWVVDNVLTHPESSATGIDIGLRPSLKHNVAISGAADRTTLIIGRSQIELRKLDLQSYDIIYIDGSHTADAVLEDLVISWRLLKPGGLMILDDYGFQGPAGGPEQLPPELRPQLPIGAFVSAYRDFVEVVYSGYQLALVKRGKVCSRGKRHCSMLGPYAYNWARRVLYKDGANVEINGAERRVVEALIRGKMGDALTIRIAQGLFESEAFSSLDSRLALGLKRR